MSELCTGLVPPATAGAGQGVVPAVRPRPTAPPQALVLAAPSPPPLPPSSPPSSPPPPPPSLPSSPHGGGGLSRAERYRSVGMRTHAQQAGMRFSLVHLRGCPKPAADCLLPCPNFPISPTSTRLPPAGTGHGRLGTARRAVRLAGRWRCHRRHLAGPRAGRPRLAGAGARQRAGPPARSGHRPARGSRASPSTCCCPWPSAAGERAEALFDWCRGFLGGFGLAAGAAPPLSEESGEALQDLARLAKATAESSDDDEDEDALAELEEFVRVAALLLHGDCVLGPATAGA